MGVLHCDLKPDNILTFKEKENCYKIDDLLDISKAFILIDYGISQKYKDEGGNHLKEDTNYTFKGNLSFTSHN
jgi:serine/threonine protein kinase